MKNKRTRNTGSFWLGIILMLCAGFLLTFYIMSIAGRISDNATARARAKSYAAVQASLNQRYEVEAKEEGLTSRYQIETTASTNKLEIKTHANVSYTNRFYDFLEHLLTPLNVLIASTLFLLRLLIISRSKRPAPAPVIIYKERSRAEVGQLEHYKELEL